MADILEKIVFKVPRESSNYPELSRYVLDRIASVIGQSVFEGRNRIFISTNLKRGLPLENINKVAGPFVEAWAFEQFETVSQGVDNRYELINVEAGKRLDPFDIVLQFKRKTHQVEEYVSADVDVKATSEDIKTAGKSPNITSFARIRSEYVEDPDHLFVILSLKYKVYGERDLATGLTHGIMEVVSHAAYDLKYVASKDITYNPALGTGQLQVRDIHYVDLEKRTTWEFLQILDKKFVRSKGEKAWLSLARKHQWIKEET